MTTTPSVPPLSGEMIPSAALKAAKSALRKEMKTRLSSLQPSNIEAQSATATAALLSWSKYQRAKRISVYLSMPSSELSTTSIVRHALENGKAVFVPYLHATTARDTGADGYLPKRCMDMVRLHGLEDFEGLERDSWGIPTVGSEGVGERERILGGDREKRDGEGGGLDLMLLPGVAFGKVKGEDEGNDMVRRLGHGKGFYDFFVTRYRGRIATAREGEDWKEPLLVGLALKEQVLEDGEEVPLGDHDALLDGLVVGDGRILGKD